MTSSIRDCFTHRIAKIGDLDALKVVMARSIEELQSEFLTSEQVAASHKVMGLDTQLIEDGTYFLVESGERIAGCGGWSFRSTLYGGDESIVTREPRRLDPAVDAAKIRAMYTDPDFKRQGIGTRVMELCENAARAAGFKRCELMATAAGIPLYRQRGYESTAELKHADVDGVGIPLLRMEKYLL
jgi:GNAT superfamily N-acetyltransferase